jgi:hypothetical protein
VTFYDCDWLGTLEAITKNRRGDSAFTAQVKGRRDVFFAEAAVLLKSISH